MSKPFFESDRALKEDYLTPVRVGVGTADPADLVALRNNSQAVLIETFKETTLVLSARFLAPGDSATVRVVYYFRAKKDDPLSVVGMSEDVIISATAFTVEQDSPLGNTFLGQDEFFAMRGAKFAKILVEAVTGEVDILVGAI